MRIIIQYIGSTVIFSAEKRTKEPIKDKNVTFNFDGKEIKIERLAQDYIMESDEYETRFVTVIQKNND